MESLWDDAHAADCVARWSDQYGEALALRTYSSQLIGREAALVLHGGGNTSVKAKRCDVLGRERDVLCVKGSGWDLATIEPQGLPALDLDALRELRAAEALSDEAMVNELRIHLFDAKAPNPSVETLLHAFLPDRFVDHTHADAALIFGNRPEGRAELEELFGAEVGVLPWIMPGFPLAKAVADYRDEHPDAIGLILHEHGVFSWGDDARTSYERMIEIVTRLEDAIATRLAGKTSLLADASPRVASRERAADCAALMRRLLAASTGEDLRPQRPLILEWRDNSDALALAEAERGAALLATSPLTPDHVIRTKAQYVVCDDDDSSLIDEVTRFANEYVEYFEACADGREPRPTMLDPFPRVVLVRGAGLFCWGKTKKDACIAADITERTLRGKALADALSSYRALSASELFEMEYWSLEQAKLGRGGEAALAGQVALITGAAGAIGRAVARELLARGAHVLLGDIDESALATAREELDAAWPGRVVTARMDVGDEDSVRDAFRACVLAFGGCDIVVPNAGIAQVASIAELGVEDWERVLRVNETGVFLTMREAARLFERQGLGGRVVLIASKNVPAPGKDFVAYSASKAAAVQIARVAALELAEHSVLVNVVHPDGVFDDEASGKSSGLWDVVGEDRMRSHGLEPDALRAHYRERNLLGMTIRAEHVARAVAFFAEGRVPTSGAALTVDGGLKETFYR